MIKLPCFSKLTLKWLGKVDSLCVIQLIHNPLEQKNERTPLNQWIKELMGRNWHITINQIYREQIQWQTSWLIMLFLFFWKCTCLTLLSFFFRICMRLFFLPYFILALCSKVPLCTKKKKKIRLLVKTCLGTR